MPTQVITQEVSKSLRTIANLLEYTNTSSYEVIIGSGYKLLLYSSSPEVLLFTEEY